MAAIKAKEKEMKDEKEAERQVTKTLSHGCFGALLIKRVCENYRDGRKRLKISERRRRRRSGMRRWRRKCIGSGWSG